MKISDPLNTSSGWTMHLNTEASHLLEKLFSLMLARYINIIKVCNNCKLRSRFFTHHCLKTVCLSFEPPLQQFNQKLFNLQHLSKLFKNYVLFYKKQIEQACSRFCLCSQGRQQLSARGGNNKLKCSLLLRPQS